LALTPDARLPLSQRGRLTIEIKLKLFQFKAPVAPRNDASDSLISKKVDAEISVFV
jgi:hypothetical protein